MYARSSVERHRKPDHQVERALAQGALPVSAVACEPQPSVADLFPWSVFPPDSEDRLPHPRSAGRSDVAVSGLQPELPTMQLSFPCL